MSLPLLQERGGALSGLVQGIGQGLQQAMPSIQEMIMSKQQADQKQRQIDMILSKGRQQSQDQEGKGVPSNLAMNPQANLELGGEGSQPPGDINWTQDMVLALNEVDPKWGAVGADLYKTQQKEKLSKEKEEREILAIQPKKFLEKVSNYRDASRNIDIALGAEIEAIKSGDTDPFSSGHVAEIMRQVGLPDAFAAPFETVGSKEFKTGQKTFLTKTFKDAMRGATTQGQIELVSSLLAEMGGKPESNLASVFLLQAQHDIAKEEVRLTDEATDKGISVYKIPRYVEQQLDKYAKKVNDEYFEAIKSLRKKK